MHPTQPATTASAPPTARNHSGNSGVTPPTNRPAPCPHCCGEGYLITTGSGYFDPHEECWMPNDEVDPCPTCHGTGHQHIDWDQTDHHDTDVPHERDQDTYPNCSHLPVLPF